MTDAAAIVDAYFAAWNASDEDRPEAVARAFAADAYYCDGAAEAVGHDQIVAMMAEVMLQFEGSTFSPASSIDTHHRQARFGWRMSDQDGSTIVEGIDAIRLGDDGRITTALGFFGLEIPETTPDVEAVTSPA